MPDYYERPFNILAPDPWRFIPFDKTQFYINQYHSIQGVKGCDWVTYSTDDTALILLELKEEKAEEDLIKEATLKFHHTLSGLLLAPICSNTEPSEGLSQAAICLQQAPKRVRLILLTEFVARPPHRAFSQNIDLTNIQMRLRQQFKPLHFNVFVVSSVELPLIPGLEDWQVTVVP